MKYCDNCKFAYICGLGLTHWLACYRLGKTEVNPFDSCEFWEGKDD